MSDLPDIPKTLEAVTEGAKAVQEVAKFGSELVVTARQGGRWLDDVFGETVRETVQLLVGDRVRSARLRAAVADELLLLDVIEKARARIEALGPQQRREVPPKVGVTLIENASIEQEPELQDLWANLLASAIDAGADPVDKIHVNILSELRVEDAVALQDYYQSWLKFDGKEFHADGVTYGPGLDGEAYGTRTTNTLFRLGLIEPNYMEFENWEPEREARYGVEGSRTQTVRLPAGLETLRFTALGVSFCVAAGLENAPFEASDLRPWRAKVVKSVGDHAGGLLKAEQRRRQDRRSA